MISQLTIFIENEKGSLANACKTIADADINMHTLFIADTQDFGVARIFCDTPKAAAAALQKAGYQVALTPVVGVRVPNHKGGLAELLSFLDTCNVQIEYGYCYAVNDEFAIDVIKVNDDKIENALQNAGYKLVEPADVYTID